jgi:hypothetical protein
MGLDGVELVMGYEDAFGIPVPNADAERLRTPGDVVDYFSNRLASASYAPCLHLSAFHLIRRGFAHQVGLPRDAVRLDARLEDLLTGKDRRQVWRSLGAVLGVCSVGRRRHNLWPDLLRPTWVSWSLLASGLGAFGACLLLLPDSPGVPRIWLGILAAALTLYLGAVVTEPLKTRIPDAVVTIGSLTEYLASTAPSTTKSAGSGWTRDQVEWVVRRVTMNVLGVASFELDDEFVRDLGVS